MYINIIIDVPHGSEPCGERPKAAETDDGAPPPADAN